MADTICQCGKYNLTAVGVNAHGNVEEDHGTEGLHGPRHKTFHSRELCERKTMTTHQQLKKCQCGEYTILAVGDEHVVGQDGNWHYLKKICHAPPADVRGDPKPGMKFDDGKVRWDLLPWAGLEEVAKVLTKGAEKYAPDNWRKVEGWRWRYFRAAIGHLAKWRAGEKNDPEWGYSHLAHAACCVLFMLELDK